MIDGEGVEVWPALEPKVRLGADFIELSRRRRRTKILLTDLAIVRRHRGDLVISTAEQSYWIAPDAVGGPEAVRALHLALRDRIDTHPEAERIRSTLARMTHLHRTFSGRRPRVTLAVLVVCAVVYAGQVAWGATLPISLLWDDDGFRSLPIRFARLLTMGANAHALINHGELFRLATANLLHANTVHFVMNVLGLLMLGPLIEQIWGPWRTAVVMGVTALAGAAASAWLTNSAGSVGVSTALLGLLGVYAVLWIRFRTHLPPAFVVPRDRWVALIAINGIIWWFIPVVDHFGHLGGALAGAALVMVVHPLGRTPNFLVSAGRVTRFMAVGLGLLFVGSIAMAAATALRRPPSETLDPVVRAAAQRSPDFANNIAWAIVTSPDSDLGMLQTARAAAAEAAEATDGRELRAAIIDTLATAHYRLGQYRAAVNASLESVFLDSNDVTRNQLARFLQAHLQTSGIYSDDYGSVDDTTVTLDAEQVTLTRRTNDKNLFIIALIYRANRLEGSLWVHWPRTSPDDVINSRTEDHLGALRHDDAMLRVALIATDRVTEKPQKFSLDYLTMDDVTRSLP